MKKISVSVFHFTFLVGLLTIGVANSPAQRITRTGQVAKNQITAEENSLNNSEVSAENAEPVSPEKRTRPNPLSRVGVQTGQTLPLTLNEAIRKALENNNEIEVAKNDVKIAESTLRSLLGFYDPVFTVTPQYTNNIQPQTTTLGGADQSGTTSQNEFRVDSSFNQPVKKGGGNFNVFFNNRRNETSNSFSQLNPTFSTNLGFSFTQPLLRNRSIDRTRQQIRIQRKRVAQSDADFRRRTIEIISQVQRAYWDLVFALRDQQNRLANLNLSKENLRQIEAKIEAGAAAPLAKAEVETELANRESDLLLASQQVSISENALKQLLLRDPNSTEWETQYVPTDKPVYSDDPIDLTGVLKDAIENRPELRRLKLQGEINAIDIDYFKNQLRPQVDLTGTYTTIGLSGTAVGTTEPFTTPLISGNPNTNASAFLLQQIQNLSPNTIIVPDVTVQPSIPVQFIGGYGKSLSNLFKNDTRSVVVGVTFSFPLRNQTAEADLATARYQQTQIEAQTRSQEQVIIAEVRNAVQAVETARQRVLTARRARENAEIQLEGERKLFEVGRSTTFLLFQRENALTNARNAEIRAETDYNKALSDLQKATSTTFILNNIQYDSPMDDN
ncbi:MAG: TolC family protein [Pyrinomonadaceae bacterium]